MSIGELTIEDAAKAAAGNHHDFRCFCWFRKSELDNPNDWAIIYTHNRDSGLLDQSNAEAIEKELQPFTEGDDPDVVLESHSHWAVGHVDGFSIRVFKNGNITEAFKKYNELSERMADYPILDEEDYSHREYEATIENIADAAWRLKSDYELPESWTEEVYSWLSDHRCSEVENRDDQGGYPSESALVEAFQELGFEHSGN